MSYAQAIHTGRLITDKRVHTSATKLLDENTHMDQVLSLSLLEGLYERYKLIICLQYLTVMERALSLLKLLERQ